MSEIHDQPISAAAFADIGARLDGGFGCFEDWPFLYVVLSMTTHQVDVLLRGETETFTDAITRQLLSGGLDEVVSTTHDDGHRRRGHLQFG
jgi:hypothetical protein